MNLFSHQQRAVEIASERKRFAFLWDCGSGKTIAVLAIIAANPLKTVVLAPKSILLSAWCRDGQHFPDLDIKVLDAACKDRLARIAEPWDVLVTNYEMFKRYRFELLDAGTRRLVVDESSRLKDHESQITRAAIEFSAKMESVYVLSGTPAPNDPTEFYGQLRCIADPAKVRGSVLETYWKWAYKVASPIKRTVRGKPVIERWEQSPEQAAYMGKVLERCAWFLRKQDVLDLPPQLDNVIAVELDDEADDYAAAEDDFRLLASGESTPIKTEAALIKLRQIVGGSVKVDGEAFECGTSKIAALNDLLDSIGPEPVVIWFEFTDERRRIVELLAKRMESFATIDGETSGDAAETAAKFQAGHIQRLVCQPQAAGHGITLTAASHAVYYSLSFSHEYHKQSRDRIHRAGMGDRPATYHYLIGTLPGEGSSLIEGDEPSPGQTVDSAMLRVVKGKASRADAVAAMLGGAVKA